MLYIESKARQQWKSPLFSTTILNSSLGIKACFKVVRKIVDCSFLTQFV